MVLETRGFSKIAYCALIIAMILSIWSEWCPVIREYKFKGDEDGTTPARVIFQVTPVATGWARNNYSAPEDTIWFESHEGLLWAKQKYLKTFDGHKFVDACDNVVESTKGITSICSACVFIGLIFNMLGIHTKKLGAAVNFIRVAALSSSVSCILSISLLSSALALLPSDDEFKDFLDDFLRKKHDGKIEITSGFGIVVFVFLLVLLLPASVLLFADSWKMEKEEAPRRKERKLRKRATIAASRRRWEKNPEDEGGDYAELPLTTMPYTAPRIPGDSADD